MKLSDEEKEGLDQIYESIMAFTKLKMSTDPRLKNLVSDLAPFVIYVKTALQELKNAPKDKAIIMHGIIWQLLDASITEIGKKGK